jgi:hypothetical protein
MRTDPARFDRVAAHADFELMPEQPVLPADANLGIADVAGPVLLTMFGLVFLLVVLSLVVGGDVPLLIVAVFVAGSLAFVLGGVRMVERLVRFRNAPVAKVVAVIVKERTDVTGGSTGSEMHTNYFATLQTRDGARTEYYTYRSLVGRLAVDDIGVAYIKSRTLVEFIRFDVD